MKQPNKEIVALKSKLLQCTRQGVQTLVKEASILGGFRAYSSKVLNPQDIRRGSGAWTTAEGILAILYTNPWFHELNYAPDFDLLAQATNNLVRIERCFENDGIPADPDLGISHHGVVDSTVKVVMALLAIRRFMLRRGWTTLHSWDRSISVDLESLDSTTEKLAVWLRNNQNEDGSWGLWYGEEGRAYPTYYAIKALMDFGDAAEFEHIEKAVSWFKRTQHEDGGWGFSETHPDSDLASTSFAILALSHVEPLWSKDIWQAAELVESMLQTGKCDDMPQYLCLPLGGITQNAKVKVTYPVKPRAICALLQSGVSPFSPIVQNLLAQIIDEELEDGGWAPQGERVAQTWYTYVVVDSFGVWFTYAEGLGSLPYYYFESSVAGIVYDQLKSERKTNLAYQRKVDSYLESNKRLNRYLWILGVIAIAELISIIGLEWFNFDLTKILSALLAGVVTIMLGMLTRYLYDRIKAQIEARITSS